MPGTHHQTVAAEFTSTINPNKHTTTKKNNNTITMSSPPTSATAAVSYLAKIV
jgi:hypothetical protein